MTDDDAYRSPGSGAGYGGPPPTERSGPQSGQYYPQPYGQQYPPSYGPQYQQPYGQQYPPQYGYPAPPGYPPAPGSAGPQRPGMVVGAAVLGFVNAGLLIVAGALLMFGASLVSNFEDAFGDGDSSGATTLVLLGVGNLVAGGLLIAGGVMFLGGKQVGRIVLSTGSALVLVLLVVWVVLAIDDSSDDSSVVFWGIVYGALSVISLGLSFASAINGWLRGRT